MIAPETLAPAATPEELLERWLDRLNDPNAIKTRFALKDEVGMCANGHLLDVSGFGHWSLGKFEKYEYVFDEEADWYSPDNDPFIEHDLGSYIPSGHVPATLVSLVTKERVSSTAISVRNDDGDWFGGRVEGLTLPEIAEFIKERMSADQE